MIAPVEISITQFRKKIFALVNDAFAGKEVLITHKGRRFRIVPEDRPTDKLGRITPLEILSPPELDLNVPALKTKMLAEMQREWEKDWEQI